MDTIKIKSQQRDRKKQSRKQINEWIMTPPKSETKKTTYWAVQRLCAKYGYERGPNETELVRKMRQDFKNGATQYLGGKIYTKKRTRFDKMKFKEETGFSLEVNPILKTYSKLDNAFKKMLLSDAFSALFSRK